MTANNHTSPDSRGRRLLPTIIAETARANPDNIWAALPLSLRVQDGFREITYGELDAAVDFLSWWSVSQFGVAEDFETIPYFGGPEIRQFLLPLGFMKAGYKLMVMSTRNSFTCSVELLKQATFKKAVYSRGTDVKKFASLLPGVTFVCVPELDEILSAKARGQQPFPYTKTFEEAEHDPILINQTSGSTGRPKPVTLTNSMLATIDAHSIPSSLDGRDNIYKRMKKCDRHYIGMSLPHASAYVRLLRAILLGVTAVLGPQGKVIGADEESVEIVKQVLTIGRADAANILPGTLQAMVRDTEALQMLSCLKFIGWGGAPLSKETGATLAKVCAEGPMRTTLHNSLGSTDGGAFVTYVSDPEDWEYICYCPFTNGISWREVEGETDPQLFEMVVVRDPALSLYQGNFKMHPGLMERSTRDLYSKHPTKAHHWKHELRLDDLLVSSNGAKLNPLPLQSKLEEHADIRSAVLFTPVGRETPVLLLELNAAEANHARKDKILEELWPIIVASNEMAPKHGIIKKGHVLIAPPERPFPRADKGSIQKSRLVKQFAEDMEDIYCLDSGRN